MKRTVKILALVLLLAMAVTAFASCGLFGKRLSGSYESTSDDGSVVLLTFDGDEWTYTKGTTQLKGTYKIKADGEHYSITMTQYESVTSGTVTVLQEPKNMYENAMLRIGEDYISIGSGTQVRVYNKK